MNKLSQEISALSPEQRALLEIRIKKKRAQAPGPEKIPRRNGNSGSLPLAFAQERLWLFDQFAPGTTAYNVPHALRLRGRLNMGALEQSLSEILRRHEALRTTFKSVDGLPVQVIASAQPFTLPLLDLGELPETERLAEARRLAAEDAQHPFDLAKGPLFRAKLLRLGKEDHVLLHVMHHIVSDGWSMGVFYRELGILYNAFCDGKPSPLPELPVQYADFALWQRQWLQGAVLEKHLSYWKQQLGGVPIGPQLPSDRPRPAVQTFNGGLQSLVLTKSSADALKSLSRQEGVTLFMTLLAAFKILLFRYTGQENIMVFSPIAGRNRPEIEDLIGFFVNTLVMRTDLSGNPTFPQLLARVREVALEAFVHQELPFEKLMEESRSERNERQHPLLKEGFALQNAPMSLPDFSGLTVEPLEFEILSVRFDLEVHLLDRAEVVTSVFVYNTDLFEADTIARMQRHFHTLLEGIAVDPDRRLSDFPMLTEAERQQVLIGWNDTKRDLPNDCCIHHLFEAQADRTPDAIAVAFEDQKLTYRELNRRANQLARYLQNSGVGPGIFVGVCMERSIEMVVAFLGILKAGGAYVPLDPTYPSERLTFMLKDAAIRVLIGQERLIARFDLDGIQAVRIDRDWPSIAADHEQPEAVNSSAEQLAYVIYTSGSTGRPKGVTVTHRAVVRLVVNTDYVELKPDDVIAQVSNSSFDAATFEIWGALLNGARLVIISKEVVLAPEPFAGELKRQGITTLFLTTALFNQMSRQMPGAMTTLRQVLFGGEAVEPHWVAQVLQHGPPRRLIHVYGPTETTTFATWQLVENVPEDATTVPIGRPIANTTCYVLDARRQPLPVGVPGELYIGGEGLARGYLNQPELAREKFVPDPFGDSAGARLYRTGDLVRRRSDGAIEFLGRLDDQVKIRGLRIEPGEIESVIRQCPMVKETAVVAREDVPGEKRLVAYVVASQGPASTTRELRSFLQQKLPSYMVPSAFVFLESLPLTLNGKVDRRTLPAPEASRPELGDAYEAPHNPVEEILARIWAEILRIDRVGIRDNFFDLGGHSLLAVRLFAQIEKRLGKALPLSTIFQAPTIEQLANILRQEAWSASWSSLVALQPNGAKPAFFWVHGENSNAFLPRYLGPDQPLYGLVHQGQDGKRARYTCIEDIAAHYLEEIRSVQPEGPYFLGGFCIGGMLVFEISQQLQKQGEKVALLLLLDPTPPHYRQLPSFTFGFPKLFSDKTALRNTIYRHLRNLSLLGPKGQLKYVLGGLKWRSGPMLTRLKEIAKVAACKGCLLIGIELPPSFRILYMAEVHRRAARNYIPQVYPGRVVLLKTEGGFAYHRPIWGRLAGAGLEVIEVPVKHTEIVFKEPQIQGLAKQLKVCLDKAQANG